MATEQTPEAVWSTMETEVKTAWGSVSRALVHPFGAAGYAQQGPVVPDSAAAPSPPRSQIPWPARSSVGQKERLHGPDPAFGSYVGCP